MKDTIPRQIKHACYLLWGSLFLGGALLLVNTTFSTLAIDLTGVAFVLIIMFALYGYLFVGIYQGRNSARILVLVFLLAGILLAPPSLTPFENAPVMAAFEFAQVFMQALALFWIFTAPGAAWFSDSRGAR